MDNYTGGPVVGDNLYGREDELKRLWEKIERGEHVLMLAPRRVGKTSLMLELRRAPRAGWDVVYVNVEDGSGAADCVAAILAELATIDRYRSVLDSIPFADAVKSVFKSVFERLSVRADIGVLQAELKSAIGREWRHAADRLRGRLANPGETESRLLIVIDELPFLLLEMRRTEDGKNEARTFLSWLRASRQAPETLGRVCTLVGGSIGLEGVLRRDNLSGLINDFATFPVESWSRETADSFLVELGRDNGFLLDEQSRAAMLDLLHDPVPFHVQLFFYGLRDVCEGHRSRVSPDAIRRCFDERLTGPGGTAHLDHFLERLEFVFDDEHERTAARGILERACRRTDGVTLTGVEDLRRADETAFRSALREIEAGGYIDREGDRLRFRSNLLRAWWRKRHAGAAAA